jgi:hypothetical protein
VVAPWVLDEKLKQVNRCHDPVVSAVSEYLAGHVGTMEFGSRMESLRFKSLPLVAER